VGDREVRLWVCSAGYGLIPADAPIRPYSATFAGPHPDSVPGGREGGAAWWSALAGWAGSGGGPRSLADLAAADGGARLLLALSAPYLAACRPDALAAAARLRHPSQLSVVCAGARRDSMTADLILPADARLQHRLGGTRASLNVRVARYLLTETEGVMEHNDMRDHLAGLLADLPPVTRYDRQPMTDAEVRQFIREYLQAEPGASHTRLLRQLRQSGRACEQGRFAALHRAETAVRP